MFTVQYYKLYPHLTGTAQVLLNLERVAETRKIHRQKRGCSELPLQERSHTAVICKHGATGCWIQREDALLSSPCYRSKHPFLGTGQFVFCLAFFFWGESHHLRTCVFAKQLWQSCKKRWFFVLQCSSEGSTASPPQSHQLLLATHSRGEVWIQLTTHSGMSVLYSLSWNEPC